MYKEVTFQRDSENNIPDDVLVERAKRGDGLAFELIVRRYNRALFRAARGVLNDEDLAQDVVQEAYLNAFKKLDTYKGQASFKTWLTRIAVNQAITVKRRQHNVISLFSEINPLASKNFEEDNVTPQISDENSPETEASHQQLKYILETAIKRLPEIYRSVFILRDVDGLSIADSSYCLNINEALVKKRLSRAREMLRKDLTREMEVYLSDIFEFAGARCDVITMSVMAELTHLRIINRD